MDVLTRERAKPALPYGGVHRLIDFALSGLVNADIADVWVSLEYQVTSIDDYLSGGRPWSLDRNRGGFRRMVPQTGTGPATETGFAHGNGDLLLRMSSDLESFGPARHPAHGAGRARRQAGRHPRRRQRPRRLRRAPAAARLGGRPRLDALTGLRD